MKWSKSNADAGAKESQSEPKDEPPKQESGQGQEEDEAQYPSLKVVVPILLSICLAVFLTALDRTIIGVAVPAISNEFNSFDDISWYESAYLLTFCAFQLPIGKAYTFFPAKWTFLTIVVIFEAGSILCAAAPSSSAFIVGRAIAGVGSAGTFTGALVIFVDLVPLRKRPKYQGFLGAVFGLASILGPILGGIFTTKVTWRWCFWINAPIGGASLIALVLLLPSNPAPKKNAKGSFAERVKQFDPVGTVLLLPGLVILLLALQWGGNQYAWSSARVVALLVLGPLLLVAFGISQLWAGDNGTVPPRILRQRSVAASTAVSLAYGATLIIITFYLPIWHQAIKGVSASAAGVRLLSYFLSTVAFVIGSGIIVTMTGYYTPWLIGGTALLVVGCGLLTTFRVNTSTGEWIGYQLLVGAGMGMSLTQCQNAVQTVSAKEDIPIAITIINFAQFFGGTVFVSVCQGVLSNTLRTKLSRSIPGLDVTAVSSSGATDLSKLVSKNQLPLLLAAYNAAIDNVFYCALAVSCVAFGASLFVEWKTVKKQPEITSV